MAEKVASCFYESFSSMYRNAAFVERQSRFCTIYLFEYETGKSFSDTADDRHFGVIAGVSIWGFLRKNKKEEVL